MNEWEQTSKKLPKDGRHVDILVNGRIVERVLYRNGRFWKVQKTYGGHTYEPEEWRYHEEPKKGGKHLEAAASDSVVASAESID